MKLSELNNGDKARIINILISNEKLKKMIMDLGITKGSIVLVKKVAPFGDPISIEIRGYELALNKKELSEIEVIKL